MNHKDSTSFNVTRNHTVGFSWFTLIIALTWITLQHKLFSDWSLNLWDEEDNSYRKISKLAVILVIGGSFHGFRIKVERPTGWHEIFPSLLRNWKDKGAKMTLPLLLLPRRFEGCLLSFSVFWEVLTKRFLKFLLSSSILTVELRKKKKSMLLQGRQVYFMVTNHTPRILILDCVRSLNCLQAPGNITVRIWQDK